MSKPPKLTPTQRRLLTQAVATGIPQTDPRTPREQAAITTLQDLELIRLTHNRKKKPTYKATDTGRGLIRQSGLAPTFLRRSYAGSNYTSNHYLAMRGEPEAFRDAA